MPRRSVRDTTADGASLAAGMAAIGAELDVPGEFPAEVQQAAEAAAQSPRLPELDRTAIPFVTIDPPGSMDLDQALHIERSGSGFTVSYAIADVAAFVDPGGLIDAEAHARGATLYGPDRRIPLHPPVLSEETASLLPGQDRPALLWTLNLDAAGELTDLSVSRALVRSRERLDYAGVQRQLDDGTAGEPMGLLREVGRLRQERELARGGVSLALPEQEVVVAATGWSLEYRALLPVEGWNAQISLLTGLAAARLMLPGKIGLLRTLPPFDPRDVARLRRTAAALRIAWPESLDLAEFVAGLDPSAPTAAAMLNACTRVLRGAAYVAFDGKPPDCPEHSAIAAAYAHATAPLRRLGDRYVGEVCVALCAGVAVPDWTRTALPALPATMAETGRRASRYESAVLDLVEAGVLASRVGQRFDGVITEVDDQEPQRGVVMIRELAIEGQVCGSAALPLGSEVQVSLVEADVTERRIRFKLS